MSLEQLLLLSMGNNLDDRMKIDDLKKQMLNIKDTFNPSLNHGYVPKFPEKISAEIHRYASILPIQLLNNKPAEIEKYQKSQGVQDFEQEERYEKVINATQYPYSCIGLLYVTFNQKRYKASAFLIHRNLIFTCMQNVYDFRQQIWATDITFIPHINGNVGKSYKIKKIEQINLKEKGQIYEQKFATLILEKEVKEYYGYLGMDFSEKNYANQQKYVIGYRSLKTKKQMNTMWQYKIQQEKATDICLEYGFTGSPILYQKNDHWYVVGIYVSRNNSFRLDKQQLNFLNSSKIFKSNKTQLRLNISDEGIATLIEAEWPEIELLWLPSNNHFTDKGFQQLFTVNWNSLSNLNVSNNQLTSSSIEVLIKAQLPKLAHLNLNGNTIANHGFSLLLKGQWDCLESLALHGNNITDQALVGLSKNSHWKLLKQLNLENNSIGPDGVRQITKCQWVRLTMLNLSQNNLQNESVRFLSQANWPQLKQLRLSNNAIEDNGIKYLIRGQWKILQILHLGILWDKVADNIFIANEGVELLLDAKWPELTILRISIFIIKYMQVSLHLLSKDKRLLSMYREVFKEIFPKIRIEVSQNKEDQDEGDGNENGNGVSIEMLNRLAESGNLSPENLALLNSLNQNAGRNPIRRNPSNNLNPRNSNNFENLALFNSLNPNQQGMAPNSIHDLDEKIAQLNMLNQSGAFDERQSELINIMVQNQRIAHRNQSRTNSFEPFQPLVPFPNQLNNQMNGNNQMIGNNGNSMNGSNRNNLMNGSNGLGVSSNLQNFINNPIFNRKPPRTD